MTQNRKGDTEYLFLGIDTSAYTTSMAVVDGRGNLLCDKRIILPVPAGGQGLKQSAALFYHLQHLPRLCQEVFAQAGPRNIQALAVSAQPRPAADSYMPVFLAGLHLAESLKAALEIPLIKATHQEGHLAAGLWSAGCPELSRFLAVHLSGGTTEILQVEKCTERKLQFRVKILGASQDLHAGQLIDRVGVAMGLPFPAGPALERVAQSQDGAKKDLASSKIVIKSAVKGLNMSFSGAETAAKKLLAENVDPAIVARAVEQCLAVTLEKVLRQAIMETKIRDILIVGGVSANNYIRKRLEHRLVHPATAVRLIYPQNVFSSDNAVGVSLIARGMVLDKAMT